MVAKQLSSIVLLFLKSADVLGTAVLIWSYKEVAENAEVRAVTVQSGAVAYSAVRRVAVVEPVVIPDTCRA